MHRTLNTQAHRAARLHRAIRPLAEAMECRLLMAGQISGTVWNDLNRNQVRDAGESGLGGWTVYLDQNRNMVRDPGETATATASDGTYHFANLPAGRYYVGQEVPLGWEQTTPGAAGATLSVSSNAPHAGMTTALTYTGSTIPISIAGQRVEGGVTPSDAQSGALINLPEMRADTRFTDVDGRGYSVVLIDTGIDLDHPFFGPDLDGNGIADRIVYQYDFADRDSNASDNMGHGSNVASIAAGSDAQYGGMAPGANIIALKVFTDGGVGDFSYIEQALQWCVANAQAYHIAAINMSVGDQQNWTSPQQLYGISDELSALASEDVIVVSAAGNEYAQYQAQGVAYPAADPNSLAVGAVYDGSFGWLSYLGGAVDYTTGPDRIASFSQRSTTLTDIFAPGAIIYGADNHGGVVGYTGTSQASPHIAGIAVLAQQLAMRYIGRRLSMGEFTHLLNTTSVTIVDGDDENDNVANTYASYRRVDAYALAQAIAGMGINLPFGYTIDLGDDRTALADFGDAAMNLTPAAPDLQSQTDTGRDDADNLTQYNNRSAATRLLFYVNGTLAGADVRLYADGMLIGSAVATGTRTTIWTDGATLLPDGPVVFTARQTADTNPESADSLPLIVRIDTTAPAPPAAPVLHSGSDTGASATDGITRDNTPTFDFTGSEAGYLSLYSGSTWINSRYVLGTGPASLTLTGGVEFLPYVSVPTGQGAYDSAIGDVDGDGKLDLITANIDARTLSVNLGRGDGTFAPPVTTWRSSSFCGVDAADFNGDGKLDVITSDNSQNVYVMFGNGTGTFTTGPTLGCTPGNYILNVRTGDVNGDGHADVMAAERSSGTIRVFLGDGAGGFDSGHSYAAGGQFPFDPQVADVNMDGRPDIVVSNNQDDQVTVLLGNGDGTFRSPLSITVGDNPVGFAVADYDSDGIPDVTVTENGAHAIEFLKGRGDGTFIRRKQFPVNYNNMGGVTGDFDLDGNMDYATTAQTGQAFYVDLLLGNGDGSFRPYVQYAAAGAPFDLDAGDFNGDGRTDLALTAYTSNAISVLIASGGGVADGQYAIRCTLEDQAGNISSFSPQMPLTIDTARPSTAQVQVNAGQIQHSMVNRLDVTFSEPVSLSAGAFTADLPTGQSVPNTTINVANPSGDQQTYVLTFSGTGVIGGSLPDGIYDLLVSATGVQDLAGNALTADYTKRFHRLFGDVDGNKVVNALDYAMLKATYGRSSADPLFDSAFDYEGNGVINALDLAQFRKRYGLSFSY